MLSGPVLGPTTTPLLCCFLLSVFILGCQTCQQPHGSYYFLQNSCYEVTQQRSLQLMLFQVYVLFILFIISARLVSMMPGCLFGGERFLSQSGTAPHRQLLCHTPCFSDFVLGQRPWGTGARYWPPCCPRRFSPWLGFLPYFRPAGASLTPPESLWLGTSFCGTG